MDDLIVVVCSIVLLAATGAFTLWFIAHMLRALALIGGPYRAHKRAYKTLEDAIARGQRMPDSLTEPHNGPSPRDYPPFPHHHH